MDKGIPLRKLYPTESNFSYVRPPTDAVSEEALTRRCKEYYRATTIKQVCKAIAQNGINRKAGKTERLYIGGSFWIFPSLSSGIAMPKPRERRSGLHDMRAVDYDMDKQAFFIRNSHGMGWQFCGYDWMPFEYFKKYKQDIWVIVYDVIEEENDTGTNLSQPPIQATAK